MKLAYVDLCGFRGYRKKMRIDFAEDFTILDGRNGVGKSTIFDAVEYALTGDLSKYGDAKAGGESVADYIWWTGKGLPPESRYVEAGFRDQEGILSIRRTEFQPPEDTDLNELAARLCDLDLAPRNPIPQLCFISIIRDERIEGLSLDLKETERYGLLRDGLGANDSDRWITRGAKLMSAVQKRFQAAQQEVTTRSNELTVATRRVDEVRAKLVGDSVLADAVERLRKLTRSEAAPDQLAGPAREWIARTGEEITSLQRLASSWVTSQRERAHLPQLSRNRDAAASEVAAATKAIEDLRRKEKAPSSSALAQQARDLVALANLGRSLGLQGGHCPLCRTGLDHDHYLEGIATAEEMAKGLDSRAADEAHHEEAMRLAGSHLLAARQSLATAEAALAAANEAIQGFDAVMMRSNLSDLLTLDQLDDAAGERRQKLDSARRDLRVLETLKLDTELEQAKREESRAEERFAAAQTRAGRTRKAEMSARALHDAARRAAGETLDRRLDRVLPLMSELYHRLRPHPVWRDIEYSIRGDVRKFLKLEVGDKLNPQFLFSSGQRRATGLAFLLSANLSLAWSKWQTIMLDDPVQHVDDFRTVHLAELAAQLVAGGRQIVCAVEDAALAEMLCRRLPVRGSDTAKRVTLGPDGDGDLVISSEVKLPILPSSTLLTNRSMLSAG